MRPGVIIMALGDFPVAGIADFQQAMAKLRETKPAELAVFARVGRRPGSSASNQSGDTGMIRKLHRAGWVLAFAAMLAASVAGCRREPGPEQLHLAWQHASDRRVDEALRW